MTENIRYEGPQGAYVGTPTFCASQYFEEVVYGNFLDFHRDTGDKRKIINALVSLWHFHEIIYKTHNITAARFSELRDFRKYVRIQCPVFDYAEAICVFYKHGEVSNSRIKTLIENITDVAVRVVNLKESNVPLSADSGVAFEIDFTKPYKADENLVMRLRDGSQHSIIDIATSLNKFWGEWLAGNEASNSK